MVTDDSSLSASALYTESNQIFDLGEVKVNRKRIEQSLKHYSNTFYYKSFMTGNDGLEKKWGIIRLYPLIVYRVS